MTTARRSKPKITPWRRRARTIADPQAIPGDLDTLFLYREVIRTDLGRRLVEAFIGIRSKDRSLRMPGRAALKDALF